MRRSIAIGTSAAVAAVFTHGMVFSAMYLNELLPISTYQGLFQHMLFATEALWSYAHGWQPMSHLRDFGRVYTQIVHLTCPLLGFALFWIVSRHKVGINFWKPIGIGLILAIPNSSILQSPFYALGFKEPWVEMLRTLLGVLLMVWSVGAVRFPKPPIPTTKSLAAA